MFGGTEIESAMPQDRKAANEWMKLSGIGIEFVGAIAGLTLAGYWWDRHFGTEPWGFWIGLSLGMVGGMYNLIRQALAATRNASSSSSTRTTRTTKRDDKP